METMSFPAFGFSIMNTRHAISAVKPGSKWLRGKFHITLLLKTYQKKLFSCFPVTDESSEACFSLLCIPGIFDTHLVTHLKKETHSRFRSKIVTTVIYRATADRALWVKWPLCRKPGSLLRLKYFLSPRHPKSRWNDFNEIVKWETFSFQLFLKH